MGLDDLFEDEDTKEVATPENIPVVAEDVPQAVSKKRPPVVAQHVKAGSGKTLRIACSTREEFDRVQVVLAEKIGARWNLAGLKQVFDPAIPFTVLTVKEFPEGRYWFDWNDVGKNADVERATAQEIIARFE